MSGVEDILQRIWMDLVERPSGPMAFRFILQPTMAAIFAIRDGMKDARMGRSPYFWTVLHDPARRGPRLREGFAAVGRVIGLGVVMEAVYQWRVLGAFRAAGDGDRRPAARLHALPAHPRPGAPYCALKQRKSS